MRVITIVSPDLYDGQVTSHFDPEEYTDSAALHHVLCQYNPGDNYTVTFKNVEE